MGTDGATQRLANHFGLSEQRTDFESIRKSLSLFLSYRRADGFSNGRTNRFSLFLSYRWADGFSNWRTNRVTDGATQRSTVRFVLSKPHADRESIRKSLSLYFSYRRADDFANGWTDRFRYARTDGRTIGGAYGPSRCACIAANRGDQRRRRQTTT